jgi:hypothetical protein
MELFGVATGNGVGIFCGTGVGDGDSGGKMVVTTTVFGTGVGEKITVGGLLPTTRAREGVGVGDCENTEIEEKTRMKNPATIPFFIILFKFLITSDSSEIFSEISQNAR